MQQLLQAVLCAIRAMIPTSVAPQLHAYKSSIGTPMYNFAVPAALKAWIDHVVRVGKTFRYTAVGAPEGLLAGMNKEGDYC